MTARAVVQAARTLPPNAFAFAMATGIVSRALQMVGWDAASTTLFWLASLGLVLILAGWIARAALWPSDVVRLTGRAESAFGFLTLVAAVDVVALGADAAGARTAGISLGIGGALAWIVLGYGIPMRLIVRRDGHAAARADGSWFLWVVATQSVTLVVAQAGLPDPTELTATVMVMLWGVGVMLYLTLVTLVTLRLLTTPQSAEGLDPSYWIYMGATAITTLAGAAILAVPRTVPVLQAAAPIVSGLTLVLWAFGVWWIPLLIAMGVWRHGVRRVPLRYTTSVWSIVFPLGMVAAASMRLGEAEHVETIGTFGQAAAYVAAAAWLLAAVAMVMAAGHRILTGRGRRIPKPPTTASPVGDPSR